MNPEEQTILQCSRRDVSLRLEQCGALRINPDPRAEALFVQRNDLDINNHAEYARQLGVGEGMTVLDIGAYIGDSTVAYLRRGCRVVAFEPFLDAFLCLLFNTRNFASSVACKMMAVGNGETVSLDYSYGDSDCGCRYVREPGNIQTTRLDDVSLPSKVHFIKIDVEGHEHEVLLGASRIISESQPIMFVESFPGALARNGKTPKMLHDLIQSYGYRLLDRNMKPFAGTDYKHMEDIVCIPL